MLQGARRAGLSLDAGAQTRIYDIRPDFKGPLSNRTSTERDSTYFKLTDRAGPTHVGQLANSAIRRWQADPAELPERTPYRPKSLNRLAKALAGTPAMIPRLAENRILAVHDVVRNDTLTGLAKLYYGDGSKSGCIFSANTHVLDDESSLEVGDRLDIPMLGQSSDGTGD